MAGKATAKSNVKNGVNKKEATISMTYIDDILLKLDKAYTRIDKTEDDIDGVLNVLDNLDLRTKKVEARLGLD
jgi:hypothetical protein|tara:strand:+ start:1852 stop:2070 length:219 start_codon:yes stop_codon:yes gene_type:complete